MYSHSYNKVKAFCISLLVLALLTPKISFALALVMGGDAYQSVVICTGTGLVRVSVSADGELKNTKNELSQSKSDHCHLLPNTQTKLERCWHCATHPVLQLLFVSPLHTNDVTPSAVPHFFSLARAPPYFV